MTEDPATLSKHLKRVTACLSEAVDYVTRTAPGGQHDAGMWAAAAREAGQALAGDPAAAAIRETRAPRGGQAPAVNPAAVPVLLWSLAEIAVTCGFCFNPTARDVRAAKLASEALDLAGITDAAAWLAAHKDG